MGDLYATAMGWEGLPAAFPALPESDRWLPLLVRHGELLRASARRVQTTSVADSEMPARLFAESLETLRIVLGERDEGTIETVVDVGSGGGFPGMVMAAVMPRWRVTLVESLRKRASLLEEISSALELTNVTVLALRAEEAGRGPLRATADLVTARAVAELRELAEYTAPLAKDGGLLAHPKGSRLDTEIADAAHAFDELGLRMVAQVACRPEVSATPWTVLAEKEGPIAERYPRRPGIPRKRPL